MNKYSTLLLFGILFITFQGVAQNYFQQEVNFKIKVELNDSLHSLSAFEEIEYINNSPDSLTFIWLHIWPNAYSNHKTAFWKQKLTEYKAKEYWDYKKNPGYIDSLDFNINGQKAQWEYHPEHVDICKLILTNPLPPGESIAITTPFYVKIPPSTYSRLGHTGQSYQITQWFPKPAVYDKTGWHAMPYLDIGEFYSEFGSFDVSITLPAGYIVGATGNLQTQSEIDWLNKLSNEKEKTNTGKLNTYIQAGRDGKKTIRYTQDNIHDFAWFANKSFRVRKSEVELPHSGRKVTTWAMHTGTQSGLWENATTYINDALHYYSLWNGDYPYDNCTAVEGALSAGAGMEYPMITIIGTSMNARSLEDVIMHEVGHNWFYGIWGFNERDFPYLDEGMNTANQLRYIETKYPGTKMYESVFDDEELAEKFDIADRTYFDSYELAWLMSERMNMNQPINTTSEDFHIMNYGFISYQKAAHAWHYLRNYLGEPEFDRIMQVFYAEWRFKHPQPKDLRQVFERETKKDLDWFFDDVIGTTKEIDYKISKVKGDKVLIKNKGKVAGPFQLSVPEKEIAIWNEGFTGKKWMELASGEKSKIVIDPEHYTLDVNRRNNSYQKGKIFPHAKPFKLQIIGSADNPNKTYLFYIPVFGLNGLNGLMPGMAFYNSFLPQKRFQFLVMPMFGLRNQDLTGNITLRYLARNNFTYQLKLKQYGYCPEEDGSQAKSYNRIQALISYRLQPDIGKGIWTDFTVSYNKLSDMYLLNEFLNLDITHANRDKLNPYSLRVHFELAQDFKKLSCEGKMKINYGWRKKDFDVRMFAGLVNLPSSNFSNIYGFSMAGRGGYADYQADYLFMNRSSGNETNPNLQGRQALISDGGFVSYVPDVFVDRVISSINLKSSLPYTNLLHVFLNLGIQKNVNTDEILPAKPIEPVLNDLQYEAGLELSLIPDIFAIYFPLAVSDDIKAINNMYTDSYWQKVRFTLKLNMLGPTGRVGDYLY
ncbi:MAG: M1 family metallopeptidase [Bacteroidales bacterium]|nr:M1 family metallopeptidase [Bacteroidales bacterium]MCF8455064.1 M1 family metallopeptidase [Bacteroidales bacterium]